LERGLPREHRKAIGISRRKSASSIGLHYNS
jgi:hypothetical protein